MSDRRTSDRHRRAPRREGWPAGPQPTVRDGPSLAAALDLLMLEMMGGAARRSGPRDFWDRPSAPPRTRAAAGQIDRPEVRLAGGQAAPRSGARRVWRAWRKAALGQLLFAFILGIAGGTWIGVLLAR